MGRVYLFADESGNFDFRDPRTKGPTRYFILTTVTAPNDSVGDDLRALRHRLAWDEGIDVPGYFHATEDSQAIRDRVFEVLRSHQFRIDSTIFAKARAASHIREDKNYFYKLAWYLHLKHVAPQIVLDGDEMYVLAASMQNKKGRRDFYKAVQDVVQQVSPTSNFKTAYWTAASDPCLQVADYCSWAIQRKWELGDSRSYDLIKDKIHSEYPIWGLSELPEKE